MNAGLDNKESTMTTKTILAILARKNKSPHW